MAHDPLLLTLREAMATDLAEGVRVLEEGLVALEHAEPGERRDAIVRDVFRAAHGLKGSARAAGLASIEATCHAMESLLGAVRDGGHALAREDYAALLAAVDALAEAQRRLAEAPAEEPDGERLEAALEAVEARLAAPLIPRGSSAPPSAPPSGARTPVPVPDPSVPRTSVPRTSVPVAVPDPSVPVSRVPWPVAPAPTPAPQTPSATPTPSTTPARPPVPAPADPAGPEVGRARARSGTLRLALERLDTLAVAGGALLAAAHQAEARAARMDELVRDTRRLRMQARSAGDGAVNVDELRRLERALSGLRAELQLDARGLERRTRRLGAEVRGLRLTPWADATAGLDRAARDVAAALGREAEVVVGGEGLELDRSVVDALREPLAQLVRNAVDHGIEPPGERRAAGKPERGRIAVSARIEGERVFVSVRDDGRGLDPARLADEARRRGIPVPDDPRRVLELVFRAGFSTRAAVTEVSGRGVGLDVVASAVRAARGTVSVSSEPGRGTAFELAVPTTLYGLRAVLARDAGQVFAIPALDVERIVRVTPDGVRTREGRPVLLAGEPVPLAPLGHALGLAAGAWSVDERRIALLLEAGGRRAAFGVNEVLAERELSLEPLRGALEGLPFASAVAVLPAGELAVVLSSSELVDVAHGRAVAQASAPRRAEAPVRRLLLADDAATTRALTRSILEASGYEVVVAADGEQAWGLLQQGGADLVLSDVEMPRMNGFDLTRAIRQSPRFGRLPVILLTALESEADRARGLEAGADAYLVKSTFDQRVLVDTISELLEEVP
jgi:two-component system, chemotaxis family, sensor kinase CheA